MHKRIKIANVKQRIETNRSLLTHGAISIKQCKHGMMMYNRNDSFVSRGLDLYGEWGDLELSLLAQLLRNGDVVLDVGANIGTHTLFFANKVGAEGFVYAFEPQRITYEFLCANLALNSLANSIPLHTGVSDEVGEIIIPILDQNKRQNFGALNIEGHLQGERVKLTSLDALQLTQCNLIKIDVEGMELKVLKGAEKTIQKYRPFLFVENNSLEGSPETIQILFDLRYNCWWHIAPYYNPNNFFKNKKNIWANLAPESNMLCIPEELELNMSGFLPVIGIEDTWVQALARQGLLE